MNKLLYLLTACALCACASQAVSPHLVKVYQLDGARQCEGGGMMPSEMQKKLVGIHVYAAQKSYLSGVAFPAVCGAATGDINVYTISEHDLNAAKARGFDELKQPDSLHINH